MTFLHPVAAVPNNLISDTVSYTTKRAAFVLLLLAGRKDRSVTVSFAALARLHHHRLEGCPGALRQGI